MKGIEEKWKHCYSCSLFLSLTVCLSLCLSLIHTWGNKQIKRWITLYLLDKYEGVAKSQFARLL